MSADDIIGVKYHLLDLFVDLDQIQLNSIEKWISSQSYRKDLKNKRLLQKSEDKLVKIGNAIKKIVPFEAEMVSENIVPPTVGDQADCNIINTYHIDEFLYDEKESEDLVKEGLIKRHFCIDCNSRNIKDLNFMSHSMSRTVLQYIFKVLLPKDLQDNQILDVGSRLGAVIYAAYYLSNASSIFGVEINKDCCEVQEKMIEQFSMDSNRIKVVHSDITETNDIVENSNVIIINVLDFFVDIQKHREIWYFFKKHFKKGTFLVCNRLIVDTLSSLDIFEDFMDWLSICKPYQLENEIFFDIEECSELYLYTVN